MNTTNDKIGYLGKNIENLSREEMIEALNMLIPKFILLQSESFEWQKKNFSQMVDLQLQQQIV